MRSIVADSGPIVSFLYRDDPDHALVKAYLRDHAVALLTTWPVVAEAWHLLLARVGIKPALALTELRGFELLVGRFCEVGVS